MDTQKKEAQDKIDQLKKDSQTKNEDLITDS